MGLYFDQLYLFENQQFTLKQFDLEQSVSKSHLLKNLGFSASTDTYNKNKEILSNIIRVDFAFIFAYSLLILMLLYKIYEDSSKILLTLGSMFLITLAISDGIENLALLALSQFPTHTFFDIDLFRVFKKAGFLKWLSVFFIILVFHQYTSKKPMAVFHFFVQMLLVLCIIGYLMHDYLPNPLNVEHVLSVGIVLLLVILCSIFIQQYKPVNKISEFFNSL